MSRELKTIIEIQRRLGSWESRDFVREMRAAACRIADTLKPPPTASLDHECLFRSIERAESEYQRIFGDFCELQSLTSSPRLREVEVEVLEIAGQKEALEKESRLLAKVLLAVRSSSSRHLRDSAAAYAVRLGRPIRKVRGKPRRFQAALDELDRMENEYLQCLVGVRNMTTFSSKHELKGLPRHEQNLARKNAQSFNRRGWGVPLEETVEQVILDKLRSPASRRKVRRALLLRKRRLAPKARAIIRARSRAARLAGYQNWASLRAETLSEATIPEAWDLLRTVSQAALKKYHPVSAHSRAVTFSTKAVWVDGCIPAAKKYLNLDIVKIKTPSRYHRSVEVYKVVSSRNNCRGFIILDIFSRPGKQDGAWTSAWEEVKTAGQLPVVGIVCSLGKRCQFSGVEDISHEFGHALHAILSATPSPFATALNLPPDAVEIPSLVMEGWVASAVARTIIRSAPPHRRQAIAQHLQALKAREDLSSALAAAVDLVLHSSSRPRGALSVARNRLGIPPELGVDPTYSPEVFPHIFGSGYDARYFSYLWCKRAAQLAVKWMKHGGRVSRARALKFFGSLSPWEYTKAL